MSRRKSDKSNRGKRVAVLSEAINRNSERLASLYRVATMFRECEAWLSLEHCQTEARALAEHTLALRLQYVRLSRDRQSIRALPACATQE